MLRALYDYAMAHPDVIAMPGCAPRGVKYVVELDGSGNFIGVRKSDVKQVLCPDVGGATRGGGKTSNVLMEKAVISLGFDSGESGKALERIEGKRACFLEYFRDGAGMVPEFQAVLSALTDDDVLAAIRTESMAIGVNAGDVVGFSVGGKLLSDMPHVRKWWAERSVVGVRGVDALDIVTGDVCVPARLFKPLPVAAAGGGKSSGVLLVSFNWPSFESYGFSGAQARNAPMAQTTADAIVDALTYLGAKAPRLGGMKFVHWYGADLPFEQDVILTSLFETDFDIDDEGDGAASDADAVNVAAVEALADRLVRSPVTGECPVDLAGRQYHIMILQPEDARMVVRRYMTGSYGDLYENLASWFGDMSLVSAGGTGLMRPRSMNALLYSLLTKSEAKAKTKAKTAAKSETKAKTDKFKPLSPLVGPVMRACIEGGQIPDSICARALAANQSRIYADGSVSPMAIQWLKIWLCRKERLKGECITMPELNREHPNIGYHCGRLMAIYEKVQAIVAPDVNADVLTRFYTACSQSPAQVLGNLQSLSVHHFKKMTSRGYSELLGRALEEAWLDIGGEVPARLTTGDRAYFSLGYWQERAELNRRIAVMKAEWAAKGQKSDGSLQKEASI